ncbi:hypothetical protein ACFQI7_02900 [Paenibacillus allorhizosphaerae]|nr:hypothetical protein [Paenibacillus allorhizosphaerae]
MRNSSDGSNTKEGSGNRRGKAGLTVWIVLIVIIIIALVLVFK